MSIVKTRIFVAAAVAGASLALAGATGVVAVAPAAAAAASPVLGHWAPAAPVPGLSALTTTSSTVSAVSCAPSADCAIGGTYDDAHGNPQAWVASGHAGTWANAIALPGSITTNGGHSEIDGVSCATGNYCVAVGETSTDQFSDRATVDVELGGTWQQAMILPGVGTSSSQALSVSCPSAGNCTVGGWYRDASNQRQAFVEDEVNGTWGLFHDVGDIPQSNTGEFAEVNSVSCGSPQNCTAAGEFTILGGTPSAFFAAEVSGRWDMGDPIGRILPTTGRSVSCPASGRCVMTGTAPDDSGTGHSEIFFTQVQGRGFSLPVLLPGIVTLSAGQTTLAVVTLKRGKATWTFPAKKLRPGTYQLTATYASSNGYDPVTSAKKKFVVTK